jgi:hypothetical protein
MTTSEAAVPDPAAGSEPPPRARGRVFGYGGVVLQLLVGVFPYSASGLLAPPLGLAVLWTVWLVLLAVAIVVARRGSAWALVVPAVSIAFWFAALTVGERLLGWTG